MSAALVFSRPSRAKRTLQHSTSGKEYRQREQLEVFSADFPRLTKEEVKELEKAGQKQELKNGRPEVRGW